MFDAVQRFTYYFLRVNNNDPQETVPYPRPGVIHAVPEEAVSLSGFNAFLRG